MESAIVNGTHETIMKFREDGLREPPLFTASNNLIIMIVGLAILIVPVLGFLICMCARTKLFQTIRQLKINHDKGSVGMPYSQFDDDTDEPKPRVVVPQDFRVLIQSDNTISSGGSPNSNSKIIHSITVKPTDSSFDDEFSTMHPTFVVPGQKSPLGSEVDLSS